MANKVYKTKRKYPCPFCEKRLPRTELVSHVQYKHEELIPENYTASRIVYDSINKTDHGVCMVCKKPVYEWDEKHSRYKNLCNSKACREQVRKIALERHIRVYNKPTLLNDGEHQEKMLAGRKISGKYKYSDGTMFTYTGKYECNLLEFLDLVLKASSKDIQMPGPILEYEYNGEKHQWITDLYYIPANLIIEVKDGGSNPNKREMPEYRGKQLAKETMITELGKFNYLRLTNNDFSQLLIALANIKYENLDQKEANNVQFFINESTDLFSEEVGGLPRGHATPYNSVWIEPYMMGNTFDITIGSDLSDRPLMRGINGEINARCREDLDESYHFLGVKYMRPDKDNDFKKITKSMSFDEAMEIIIGHKIRILDELALYPEWKVIDEALIKEEQEMLNRGLKHKALIKRYGFINEDGEVVRGSVILSNSPKGYYVHTPSDYFLSSDYYMSPSEIPENVVDTMNDLYEQYKRRIQDEYSE